MKVLHVIWSSNIGGIENVVMHLCKAQQSHSTIEPTLFAAKSEGPLIEQLNHFKISYVKGGFKSGYTNISKLSNCVKVFKNFDIIHLHSFNPILALAAVLAKKKIVFTEHGNFGFERKKRFFEKLVKSFQGYFLRNFPNAILFNSNFTKSVAQNSYRLADKNTYVVYNGIEVPNNVETEVKYDLNNTYKIGFVGFKTGPGLSGFVGHLIHEWVIITNLLLLLVGFYLI